MTEGDHYSEERLKEHQSTFTEFADEVTAHYRNLIAKASTAPKDAWEHWEGFLFSFHIPPPQFTFLYDFSV